MLFQYENMAGYWKFLLEVGIRFAKILLANGKQEPAAGESIRTLLINREQGGIINQIQALAVNIIKPS
jgi:hypothetical protein